MTEALAKLRRDYLPNELAEHLQEHCFDGSVAVQARQTFEENDFLLGLAREYPAIKGVVGWVDLKSDRVEEDLERFAGEARFVGVRHVLQDEGDDYAVQSSFVKGVKQLAKYDLTYDLLVYPRQLNASVELVERVPGQKFVLDHLGKPEIRTGKIEDWSDWIRRLAGAGSVYCKLSGMVTEAAWGKWRESDFKQYLDFVFEAFGPGRLMYGSDWPVCLLAASYGEVFGIVQNYIRQCSEAEQGQIMGGNAAEFYGLQGE